MTDAANRKVDPDFGDAGDISRDDPLFELSQIIGYAPDDSERREDIRADEIQIDLEEALLRELDPQEDPEIYAEFARRENLRRDPEPELPVVDSAYPDIEPATEHVSDDAAALAADDTESGVVEEEGSGFAMGESDFDDEPIDANFAKEAPAHDWPDNEPVADEIYEAPAVVSADEEAETDALSPPEPSMTEEYPQETIASDRTAEPVFSLEGEASMQSSGRLEDELLAMLSTLGSQSGSADGEVQEDRGVRASDSATPETEPAISHERLGDSGAYSTPAPEVSGHDFEETPYQSSDAWAPSSRFAAASDDAAAMEPSFEATSEHSTVRDEFQGAEGDPADAAYDVAEAYPTGGPQAFYDDEVAHDVSAREPEKPGDYSGVNTAEPLEAELIGEAEAFDDEAIFSEFESALSDDLALSLDESMGDETDWDEQQSEETTAWSRTSAPEARGEPDYDIPDFDAAFAAALGGGAATSAAPSSSEKDTPPALETAEMPSADMETIEPFDLPELPPVDDERSPALDIESELDAAIAGFDQYDGRQDTPDAHVEQEPFDRNRAAMAAASAHSPVFDIDATAFENELARDLQYVGHDLNVGDSIAYGDETDIDREGGQREEDKRRSSRGLMIAAVVGGVAILGVVGAFGLYSGETVDDSGPVLVKADTEPVKIVPEDPGGKTVPNQDRAVYEKVDGSGETTTSQETLVSTSEEPIDLSSQILPPGVRESTGTAAAETPQDMTPGKSEARLQPETEGLDPATPAPGAGAPAIAPRRVRTVIVKPDGTFVAKPAAPEAQIPETQLTAATPPATTAAEAVQTAEAADTATSDGVAQRLDTSPDGRTVAAEGAIGETPASETDIGEIGASDDVEDFAATEESAVPIRTAPTTRVAPGAIPERPADQPVTIVNQDAPQVASAPQASQPQPAATSEYTVQIASQPTAESAQQTANALSNRYSNLLGGRGISIQQAEIEGRGTFHRVRVATSSRQDAIDLCERYKAAGGSCFVAK